MSLATPGVGNVERVVARGELAVVHAAHHAPGPHRDPAEELLEHPTIVFTTAGRWLFQSRRGRAAADPRSVLLGNAGESYRARHDDSLVDDRSIAVSLIGVDATFDVPAVARTAELERLRLALTAAAGPSLGGSRVAPVNPVAGALDVDAAALGLVEAAVRGRRPARSPADRDAVQAALDYLGRHAFDEAIDLVRLAGAAAVSPFHLHRLFRAEVGLTPGRYLTRVRLDHAAALLLDTDRPVTRIAFDAGFGSLGHFHATFRGAFGRTPGTYRRLGPNG